MGRMHRGHIGGESQVDRLYGFLSAPGGRTYTALDICRGIGSLNPSTLVSQLRAELREKGLGHIVTERVRRRVRGEWKQITAYRLVIGG